MSDNISATRQNSVFTGPYSPFPSGTFSEVFTPGSSQEKKFFACPFAKASPDPWIWECGLTFWPVGKLKDGIRHHIMSPSSTHRKHSHGPDDPNTLIFKELDRWNKECTRKQWDEEGAVQTWNTIYKICRGIPYNAEDVSTDPYWSKEWVRESMNCDIDSHADHASRGQPDYADPNDMVFGLRQLSRVVVNSLRARLRKAKEDAKEPLKEAMGEIEKLFKHRIKSYEQHRHKHKNKNLDSSNLNLAQRPDHDLQGFDQLHYGGSNFNDYAPFPIAATENGLEVMHPTLPQVNVISPEFEAPAFETVLKQRGLQNYSNDFHDLSNASTTFDTTNHLQYAGVPQYDNSQHNDAPSYESYEPHQTNLGPIQYFPRPTLDKFLGPPEAASARNRAHSMTNIHQAVPLPMSPRPSSYHDEPSQSFSPNDRNSLDLNQNVLGPSLTQYQWSFANPQHEQPQNFGPTQQDHSFGSGPHMSFDESFNGFFTNDKWSQN